MQQLSLFLLPLPTLPFSFGEVSLESAWSPVYLSTYRFWEIPFLPRNALQPRWLVRPLWALGCSQVKRFVGTWAVISAGGATSASFPSSAWSPSVSSIVFSLFPLHSSHPAPLPRGIRRPRPPREALEAIADEFPRGAAKHPRGVQRAPYDSCSVPT